MQGVERITAILVELSRNANGSRLADLVEAVGLAPASAHRLLAAMRSNGLVSQSPSDRRYFLGPLTRQLGAAALPDTLSASSNDFLHALRDLTGETVLVGQWTGDFAVCTDMVESAQAVRLSVSLGQSIPLFDSPAGRVLLAYLPEAGRARLHGHTPSSVDDAELSSSLRAIRSYGYAEFTLVDDAHAETEIPIWSVAAPLLTRGGALAGVLAIVVPSFRIPSESSKEPLRHASLETAMKISRRLGYRGAR